MSILGSRVKLMDFPAIQDHVSTLIVCVVTLDTRVWGVLGVEHAS